MPEWVITFLAPFVPFIAAAIAAGFWRHGIIAFLEARVRQGIKHEFDKKLEEFRADLREKGEAVAALRDGALAGMISQQTALFKRRIEAIDQIWSDIVVYRDAKFLVLILCMDAKHLQTMLNNPQMRKLLLEPSLNIVKGKNRDESKKAEIFVSPMAWALTQAYFHIMGLFIFGAQGINQEFFKVDKIIATLQDKIHEGTLKEVLPEHALMIEERGYRCYSECLDIIERKIIKEFHNMLEGEKADEQSAQRAARILDAIAESQKKKQQQDINPAL